MGIPRMAQVRFLKGQPEGDRTYPAEPPSRIGLAATIECIPCGHVDAKAQDQVSDTGAVDKANIAGHDHHRRHGARRLRLA